MSSNEITSSYVPNKWQTKAHTSHAQNLVCCGGLGGGKSVFAIQELLTCALQNPGSLFLIGRKTLPSLRDTTYRTFFAQVDPALIIEHNKANLTVKIVGGSEFIFRPLDDEEKFKSMEIAGFFVDEANEIDRSMYNTLQSRVRQKIKGKKIFYRTILALNPTDEDHWIPQLFVHEKPFGHEIHFSSSFDNEENLPEGYIDSLKAMYTPDMQERMIWGKFGRVHKGRPVFPQFSRGHYIRPIEIDRTQTLIRGWDFGFRKPAVSWLQYVGGQVRVLACLKGDSIYLDDFVNLKVIPYEKELFGMWTGGRQDFCDPRGSDESDKGVTSVQILNELGIYPAHRRTKIIEGIQAMKVFMDTQTNEQPNFIIHPRCNLLIEALRGGYARLDGEEMPDKTSGFDDLVDSIRYPIVHLKMRAKIREFNAALSQNPGRTNPRSGRFQEGDLKVRGNSFEFPDF